MIAACALVALHSVRFLAMTSLLQSLRALLGPRRMPKAPPPVHFTRAVQSEAAPASHSIPADTVHLVIANNQQRWAMLLCPCGCGETITLSLQPVHRPHWRFFLTPEQRISLRPSVWRTQGCKSHFVLDDGRVYWT